MAARVQSKAATSHQRSVPWLQGKQQKRHFNDMKRKVTIPAWTANGEHSQDSDGETTKRRRSDDGPLVATDIEGRAYNMQTVVVNFANVGANFAKKVLKRNEHSGPQMLFDWEGIRRCVMYLTLKLGLKVVGVIYENFIATDNDSANKTAIPADIHEACESIEETPRIDGRNQKSADDEMTIKCAYNRNCRFMDNDNYRDWKNYLRDQGHKVWLENCQDLLQMRYFFDSSMGNFELLDGNLPPGLLAHQSLSGRSSGGKIPAAVIKPSGTRSA